MVIISLLVCLIFCVIACSFAIWCKLDYIGKVLEFKNEPIQANLSTWWLRTTGHCFSSASARGRISSATGRSW